MLIFFKYRLYCHVVGLVVVLRLTFMQFRKFVLLWNIALLYFRYSGHSEIQKCCTMPYKQIIKRWLFHNRVELETVMFKTVHLQVKKWQVGPQAYKKYTPLIFFFAQQDSHFWLNYSQRSTPDIFSQDKRQNDDDKPIQFWISNQQWDTMIWQAGEFVKRCIISTISETYNPTKLPNTLKITQETGITQQSG